MYTGIVQGIHRVPDKAKYHGIAWVDAGTYLFVGADINPSIARLKYAAHDTVADFNSVAEFQQQRTQPMQLWIAFLPNSALEQLDAVIQRAKNIESNQTCTRQ